VAEIHCFKRAAQLQQMNATKDGVLPQPVKNLGQTVWTLQRALANLHDRPRDGEATVPPSAAARRGNSSFQIRSILHL